MMTFTVIKPFHCGFKKGDLNADDPLSLFCAIDQIHWGSHCQEKDEQITRQATAIF